MRTPLSERLGLQYPIVQAPMAGGGSSVALVVESSRAGALGSVGAAYLSPQQILEYAAAIRAATDRPFSVNLFAPLPDPHEVDASAALARLRPFHAELGIDPPVAPAAWSQRERFDAQIDAVLEAAIPVVSFTFGIPSPATIQRLKDAKTFLIGTATTVDEALQNQRAGMDAVVAQGSEAGGHRGTFAVEYERAMIGTMALVPAIVSAVRVPVIAAGGIMDGRGIAAALALGAQAAALGTAFLTTREAGVPEAHKRAILETSEDRIAITRAFSGRAARGIRNRVMDEFDAHADAIAPYPVQNDLTRPMRSAAAKAGDAHYLSLWSGQAPRLARSLGAAELVRALAAETHAAIEALRQVDAVEVGPVDP